MSFWSKLGKGLLIGGGALATALTAGAASPLLAAAVGAGTGALNGAVSGGKKGALLGGLLGGVTGGLGGGAGAGAAGAAKATTGQIIKNTLLNPATDLKIAGGVVGGKPGALMSLSSMAMPGGGLIKPSTSSGLLSSTGASGMNTTVPGDLIRSTLTNNIPNIPLTSGLPAEYGGVPDIPVDTGFGGLPPEMGGAGPLTSTPIAGSAPVINAGGQGDLSGRLTNPVGSSPGSSFAGTASNLMRNLLTPNGLKALGGTLGAVSQTQASNRGTKLDAQMAADQMKIAAAGNQRAEDSELWKMLQAADYMKSGGTPKKDNYSSSGFKLPSYNFGPAPISDANKAMASTMETQLLNRLNNPLKLSDYSQQMDPSGTEKALDWISPVLSGVGAVAGANQPLMPGVTNNNNMITTPMTTPNQTVRRNG